MFFLILGYFGRVNVKSGKINFLMHGDVLVTLKAWKYVLYIPQENFIKLALLKVLTLGEIMLTYTQLYFLQI